VGAGGEGFRGTGGLTFPGQRPSLAHADWDQDLTSYMFHAYFAKLTNAPYKRYVEIGEGTHTVMMEKTACSSSRPCSRSSTGTSSRAARAQPQP
jgi:hypothetical protein